MERNHGRWRDQGVLPLERARATFDVKRMTGIRRESESNVPTSMDSIGPRRCCRRARSSPRR